MKNLFKPVENPHRPDTFRERFIWWKCRKFGHTFTGPHYGMPLADCWNCGKKHKYNANKDAPEWSK